MYPLINTSTGARLTDLLTTLDSIDFTAYNAAPGAANLPRAIGSQRVGQRRVTPESDGQFKLQAPTKIQ